MALSTGGLSLRSAGRTFAKPKVGCFDYSAITDATRLALSAKFAMCVRDMNNSMASSNGRDFLASLKALNPAIITGQYVIISQFDDPQTSGQDGYAMNQMLAAGGTDGAGWWCFAAGTSTKTRADTGYPEFEVNVTNYVTQDSNRKRAPQRMADIYGTMRLSSLYAAGVLDVVFDDNVFYEPRPDQQVPLSPNCGDYNLDGVNDAPTDATVQSEWRKGHARFWTYLRQVTVPGVKIIANSDANQSNWTASVATTELVTLADYAFLEAVTSKSYSPDTFAGFTNSLAWYRSALGAVRAGGMALFNTYINSGTDSMNRLLQKARYGLGFCMLDEGMYILGDSKNSLEPYWIDEFDAQIGRPAEVPPVAAWSNGVWKRAYQNGCIVVNPTDNKGRWMANAVGGLTLARASNVVTLSGSSLSGHGKSVGDPIRIEDCTTDSTFNGTFTLTAAGATSLSWAQVGSNASHASPQGFWGTQTTVDLTGLGYKRILGTQDAHNDYLNGTSQNDGTVVTTLTLWSSDAVVLLKQ